MGICKKRTRFEGEELTRSRANNTNLYVYGSYANMIAEVAIKKDEVQRFVRNLVSGETFTTLKTYYMGAYTKDVVSVVWKILKVYPNFVLCEGPGGFRQGLTYADVYFNMNKKGEE